MSNFNDSSRTARGLLLDLYQAAVAAVDGEDCVVRQLSLRPMSGRVWSVAIGKAAAAMLAGARLALGEQLEYALLITKNGYAAGPSPAACEVIEAGHPLPDANSLYAGRRLLELLAEAPRDVQWLFLISGGASSLVEVLPAGLALEDLQRLNAWLLASAWPIGRINALRRQLSRIKGGRLLDQLHGRHVRALLISDVPDDTPSVIGSGLLFPPIEAVPWDPAELPAWLCAWLDRVARKDAESSGRPRVEAEIVARLGQALDAVAERAAAHGYPVYRATTRLDRDAVDTGRQIAATLRSGAPGIYLWGGETTVRLPDQPGQGGRCQQLALAAAVALAGQQCITVLAAGTDGSDGPGDVAGACVDGGTLARGALEGLDALTALRQADAGRFLEAAGDLLDTGPTGTNVNDVVIGLKTVAI